MISYRKINTAVSGLLLATCLAASPALAVTTVDSSAYDLSVSLKVLSLGVDLVNVNPYGGVAGASYGKIQTGVAVNQNLDIGVSSVLGVREFVKTGALTSAAQSPFPDSQSGSAKASISNLETQLGIYTLTSFGDLLSLDATTITSRSVVTAPGGVADGLGFATLEGLSLSGTLVAGALANIKANAIVNGQAAPNTTLFFLGTLGQETLKIILNEQTETKSGGTASISTNAIHIIFANLQVAGIGLLKGDIIIGHSQARIIDAADVVPEPATWLQMIAGFGTIGFVTRRRRAQAKRLLATAA